MGTYPTNTTHMFNPDNKYGVEKMRKEARKRAEQGRMTVIHNHTANTLHEESDCNDCEKYEPKE